MLQCQPWPEKQNLHLFLNVLNFKPLEMMQKRFFSEPVSCEEKHPSRENHSAQPSEGTQCQGDTDAFFPMVWALSFHHSQALTWARFYHTVYPAVLFISAHLSGDCHSSRTLTLLERS